MRPPYSGCCFQKVKFAIFVAFDHFGMRSAVIQIESFQNLFIYFFEGLGLFRIELYRYRTENSTTVGYFKRRIEVLTAAFKYYFAVERQRIYMIYIPGLELLNQEHVAFFA